MFIDASFITGILFAHFLPLCHQREIHCIILNTIEYDNQSTDTLQVVQRSGLSGLLPLAYFSMTFSRVAPFRHRHRCLSQALYEWSALEGHCETVVLGQLTETKMICHVCFNLSCVHFLRALQMSSNVNIHSCFFCQGWSLQILDNWTAKIRFEEDLSPWH